MLSATPSCAYLRRRSCEPIFGNRGLARVRQFSWDQVAVETSALYAEVTGTKRD